MTRLEQRLSRLEAIDAIERRAPTTQAELAEARAFIQEIVAAFPPPEPMPHESLMQRLVVSIGTHDELREVFERRADFCPLSVELTKRAARWTAHDAAHYLH